MKVYEDYPFFIVLKVSIEVHTSNSKSISTNRFVMAGALIIVLSKVMPAAQFVALAFLIICCVTAPIIRPIGLSKLDNFTFGVFGYCSAPNNCSPAQVRYHPERLGNSDGNWNLSTNRRLVLGKLLIATPISAGVTFLSMLSNTIKQFRSTRESSGMFIINFFLCLLAFCGSCLVCIVVFLLFSPHITWCSYLLIPAAGINLFSIPFTFFSRPFILNDSANNKDSDQFNFFSLLNDQPIKHSVVDGYDTQDLDLNNESKYYETNQLSKDTNHISEESDLKSSDNTYKDPDNTHSIAGYTNLQPSLFPSVIQDQSSSVYNSTIGQKSPIPQVYTIPRNNPYEASLSLFNNNATTSDLTNMNDSDVGSVDHRILQNIINNISENEGIAHDTERFMKGHLMENSDGIKDDDSDFTSVSQRGVNPNYCSNSMYNDTKTSIPPQFYPDKHHRTSLPMQQTQNDYYWNQHSVPQLHQPPDVSDLLLQNIPDFAVTERGTRRPSDFNNKSYHQNPSSFAHYKPAYKKRLSKRSHPLPPSIGMDNPYENII